LISIYKEEKPMEANRCVLNLAGFCRPCE